ncbi:DUF4417 domain-containing protein [Lachnospira sp.]|uniref:DUF4417 domain-containing protein n=1 Tax=Lachnospira sp. TaxID=2049031 RepID=UPI00257A29F0|nr:DUF4417 domain-containing protein [Lachnospira sp.]
MQIRSMLDLFISIDEMYDYLKDKDITFDENGLPIFTKDMFLDEWPEMVVPYSQRKNWRIINPAKTVLCFFGRDKNLYPRIGKVLDEIEEYSLFMGVIGMDVTVTSDMDEEWQEAIILLNHLFLAVLAVNGIKILLNTRTGGLDPDVIFKNTPHGVMVAAGFLGCDTTADECDYSFMKKILVLLPEKLILYGKHDKIAERQLDILGIDFRTYTDFHRLCKEVPYVRQ